MYNESHKAIKHIFEIGHVTKQQYTEGLKEYQHAVEEMKSHEREEAVALGLSGCLRPE